MTGSRSLASPLASPLARQRSRVAALALAAALPLALSACGGDDTDAGSGAERRAEQALESAAPGSDVDVEADGDGTEVSVDGADGDRGSFSTSGELPDGFPDEVDLVGDVEFSGSADTMGGRTGWTVTTRTDTTAVEAYDRAVAALKKAGFSVGNLSQGVYANLTGRGYNVVVAAADTPDGKGATLTYAVSELE